jgi:hypothetical protein
MQHRDAVRSAAKSVGALVSGLHLRSQVKGWGLSTHELLRAFKFAEAEELIAVVGRNEAAELVQEQLHHIRNPSVEESYDAEERAHAHADV